MSWTPARLLPAADTQAELTSHYRAARAAGKS